MFRNRERGFSFEHKQFQFKIEDGGDMIIINEIIRNNKYSVKIDFGGVHWLIRGLNKVSQSFGENQFFSKFHASYALFLLQRYSNKNGCFISLSILQHGIVKGVVVFPAGRKGEGWSGVAGELDRLLFALPTYRMYNGMTGNRQEETEQLRKRRPCKNTSTSGGKLQSLNNITEVCRSQEQKRKSYVEIITSKQMNQNRNDNNFSALRKDLGDNGTIGLNQFKSPVKLIEGQSKENSWKPKGFKSGEIRSNINNNILVHRKKENKEVEVLNYEEEAHETSSEGEEEGDTDDSGEKVSKDDAKIEGDEQIEVGEEEAEMQGDDDLMDAYNQIT
ncbi:hypothetical protein LguiB_020398 [Lonicera macranthoides]